MPTEASGRTGWRRSQGLHANSPLCVAETQGPEVSSSVSTAHSRDAGPEAWSSRYQTGAQLWNTGIVPGSSSIWRATMPVPEIVLPELFLNQPVSFYKNNKAIIKEMTSHCIFLKWVYFSKPWKLRLTYDSQQVLYPKIVILIPETLLLQMLKKKVLKNMLKYILCQVMQLIQIKTCYNIYEIPQQVATLGSQSAVLICCCWGAKRAVNDPHGEAELSSRLLPSPWPRPGCWDNLWISWPKILLISVILPFKKINKLKYVEI